jgi:hypothetical protein
VPLQIRGKAAAVPAVGEVRGAMTRVVFVVPMLGAFISGTEADYGAFVAREGKAFMSSI